MTSKLLKYLSNCSLYIYYKKPVATDCNQFLSVFGYSKKGATGNGKFTMDLEPAGPDFDFE